MIALWHSRLWFVWGVGLIFVQGSVDFIVSNYGPFKAPLKSISPKNTIFGWICGAAVCFTIHYTLSLEALATPWFNAMPTKMSLKPLDFDALHIDMSSYLYKNNEFDWNLGPLGEYRFVTQPADLHLFAITAVIALLASFARVFADGIKKALRTDSLGLSLYSGGISDHLAAVCFLGLFLSVYINAVIYKSVQPMDKLKDLIIHMTPEAQKELLMRMKDLP